LISKNTLQIEFYQFFTLGTYSMFYSRKWFSAFHNNQWESHANPN
jgi:hypothetical protein